jgi:hypothetical protein
MFKLLTPSSRSAAIAAALGTLVLAGPSYAATLLAQATPPSAPAEQPGAGQPPAAEQATPPQTAPQHAPAHRHARTTPEQRIEARINDLHTRLQITDAQAPQWNAVAQVMRDNAETMSKLIRERAANAKTMNAVQDLQSYEQITSAHAEGLKKLVPAFDALYNTMTDPQKKNADLVFRSFEHHPTRHKRKS